MRGLLCLILFILPGIVAATPDVTFSIGNKQYQLSGGHAVVTKKKGKIQLIIAVKDLTAKAMFALTAELPLNALENPQELTSEYNALSLVLMNQKGIYSLVPHTTLARDDFMRYHTKQETITDEMEDDPDDRIEEKLHECRHHSHVEHCQKITKEKRRKRRKVRVEYKKTGPTWVSKSRDERIRTGDGVMREEKYRDTLFILRLNPVIENGKLMRLTGTFGGVVLYNEGMAPAVKTPIQGGQFSVQVQNVP
jgi:hypothetical protein